MGVDSKGVVVMHIRLEAGGAHSREASIWYQFTKVLFDAVRRSEWEAANGITRSERGGFARA